MNQGQLKALVAPFYKRLAEVGYIAWSGTEPAITSTYPWYPIGQQTGAGIYPWDRSLSPADNYSAANIGQAKFLFSFDFNVPLDASPIAITINEDTPARIDLKSESWGHEVPVYSIVTNGSNGVATVNGNRLTYWPNAHYFGSDTVRYKVDKGSESAEADITITVNSVNDAPLVDAGPSLTAIVNIDLEITGNSIYDVENDATTVTWRKESGPGNVIFLDDEADVEHPTVKFDTAGEYILRFSVRDSSSTRSDTLLVIVQAVAPTLTVSITEPMDGTVSLAPATFDLEGTVSDEDATVEIYEGTRKLGNATVESNGDWTYHWANVVFGAYGLTAKAHLSSGESTVSTRIIFKVATYLNGASNNAPSGPGNNGNPGSGGNGPGGPPGGPGGGNNAPQQDPSGDGDKDGIANVVEEKLGLDPDASDSDSDGKKDGVDGAPLMDDFAPKRLSAPRYLVYDLDLDENAEVLFINNKGQVVYKIPPEDEDGFDRYYFWEKGASPKEIVVSESESISIEGLNNNGTVVGSIYDDDVEELHPHLNSWLPSWIDAAWNDWYDPGESTTAWTRLPFVWRPLPNGSTEYKILEPHYDFASFFEGAVSTQFSLWIYGPLCLDDEDRVVVGVGHFSWYRAPGNRKEKDRASMCLWENPFTNTKGTQVGDEHKWDYDPNDPPEPDDPLWDETNAIIPILINEKGVLITHGHEFSETGYQWLSLSNPTAIEDMPTEDEPIAISEKGHVFLTDGTVCKFLRNTKTGELDNIPSDDDPEYSNPPVTLEIGVNLPRPPDLADHSTRMRMLGFSPPANLGGGGTNPAFFKHSNTFYFDNSVIAINSELLNAGKIWTAPYFVASNNNLTFVGSALFHPENGDPVRKQVLFIPYEFVEINEDETTSPATETRISAPSPVVTITSCTLSEVTPNSDADGLIGNLTVGGKVRSDICDITKGPSGVINKVKVYVNESEEPVDEITLNVAKAQDANPESLRRPFDYEGTFSSVALDELEFTEGINTIRFEAVDPIYGAKGSCVYTVNITATPNGDFEQDVSAQVNLTSFPSAGAIDTIEANISVEGSSTGLQTYTETGLNTRQFSSTSTGVVIKLFLDTTSFDAGASDSFTVSIAHNSIFGNQAIVALDEGAVASLNFSGSTTLEREPEDYTEYSLANTQPVLVRPSTRGEYHPLAMRFGGQEEFLVDLQIQMADGWTEIIQSEVDERYYLRMNPPATMLIVRPFAEAMVDPNISDEELAELVRDLIKSASEYDYLMFMSGYAHGLLGGGSELIKTTFGTMVTVSKWLTTEANIALGLVRLGTGGEAFPMTTAFLDTTSETAKVAGLVLWKMFEASKKPSDAYFMAVVAEDFTEADALGAQMIEFKKFSADIMQEALLYYASNVPEDLQGYYAGRVAFEIASLFIAWEAIVPGVALTKAAFLTKLATRPLFAGRESAGLVRVFLRMRQLYVTTKICFVAGTLVQTPDGPKAIESIKPGDIVWSRNAETHRVSAKAVAETFVTYPKALHRVQYTADEVAAASPSELVCTGEHPFYVSQKGQFIPANELHLGDNLVLLDGTSARVTGLSTERAANIPYTTYNFEVLDNHTYFVGPEGVWVHNFSTKFCDEFAQLLELTRKRLGIEDVTGKRFQILEEVVNGEITSGKIIDATKGNYALHVTGEESTVDYASRHATPSGANPSDEIYSYTKQKELRSNFGADGVWEIHHWAERRISKGLGIPEAAWDSSPSINLPTRINSGYKSMAAEDLANYRNVYGRDPVTHRGPDGIKEAIDKIYRDNGLRDDVLLQPSDQQKLIDGLHQLYTLDPRYAHLQAWPATRDWLKLQLPGTTLNIPN